MTLAFSQAAAGDLEEVIALHTRTFPDARGHDARARHFTTHPLGGLEDVWLARESALGNALVAHASLFSIEAWFGESPVSAGAIASLGVAPEVRRRGIATQMMAHLHAVADARSFALTIVDPLRQPFYGRFGYGMATPYLRLRFAPDAVSFPEELSVRSATGADRAALEACWHYVAARRTGALSRSSTTWDALLADERRTWLVAEESSNVEGYLAWTLSQRDPAGDTTLLVEELAARSDRAMRTLWAAAAAQRDQVTEIHADVAEHDPIRFALLGAARGRPAGADAIRLIGEVAGGPMLRIVNPFRALAARGWSNPGRIVIETEPARIELTVAGGRAVTCVTEAPPDIEVERPALSSIAFGAMPPSRVAQLGNVRARDPAALAVADALFALPPYFSPAPF